MGSPSPRAVSVLREMRLTHEFGDESLRIPKADFAGIFVKRASAAKFLGVPVSRLARWQREGRGPQISRIAGQVYFDRLELARWVQAHRALSSIARNGDCVGRIGRTAKTIVDSLDEVELAAAVQEAGEEN